MEDDLTSDPTTLGLKVVDSNEVRKKQSSQFGSSIASITTPQRFSNLGPEVRDTPISDAKLMGDTHTSNLNSKSTTSTGSKFQSKLLVPGAVYTTPTKFTPFKPMDLFPQNLKALNRQVDGSKTNIGETLSPIYPPIDPKALTTEQKPTFGPSSPTTSSPNSARKLVEVFQQEGDRLDGKDRLETLVHSI